MNNISSLEKHTSADSQSDSRVDLCGHKLPLVYHKYPNNWTLNSGGWNLFHCERFVWFPPLLHLRRNPD